MKFTQEQAKEMFDALNAGLEMVDKALPKFDWGRSFLDAEAIRLLNDVPTLMRSAVKNAASEAQRPERSEEK